MHNVVCAFQRLSRVGAGAHVGRQRVLGQVALVAVALVDCLNGGCVAHEQHDIKRRLVTRQQRRHRRAEAAAAQHRHLVCRGQHIFFLRLALRGQARPTQDLVPRLIHALSLFSAHAQRLGARGG
jgi:hypothetical protein